MRTLLSLCVGLIVCLTVECKEIETNQDINSDDKPICNPLCYENAHCSMKGVCECNSGYIDVKGYCKPHCPEDCGHGQCIKPGECKCFPDYTWNNDTKKCEIPCDPPCSANAYCGEYGRCVCKHGYMEKNSVCQPICPRGYKVDPNKSTCQPQCRPKCGSHSYCRSPYKCECLAGYVPNDPRKLSCSLPLQWWFYLVIALLAVVIICSLVGIIYYCTRARNINYYPNSNFNDNVQICKSG